MKGSIMTLCTLALLTFGCIGGDDAPDCYAPTGEFVGTMVLDPESTACADVEDLSGTDFRFATGPDHVCGSIGSHTVGSRSRNAADCLVIKYAWGSADEEGFYDMRQRIEMTCATGGACAWEYDIVNIRER